MLSCLFHIQCNKTFEKWGIMSKLTELSTSKFVWGLEQFTFSDFVQYYSTKWLLLSDNQYEKRQTIRLIKTIRNFSYTLRKLQIVLNRHSEQIKVNPNCELHLQLKAKIVLESAWLHQNRWPLRVQVVFSLNWCNCFWIFPFENAFEQKTTT